MTQSGLKPNFLAFALPAAMGILLTIAVGGLVIAGYVGRDPSGERLTVRFESDCAPAWESVVAARAAEIGLGEPELSASGDALVLTATFPGLEDARETLPALLVQPGRLGVFVADEDDTPSGEALATEADIESVELQLDLRVHPVVEIMLERQARDRVHEAARESPVVYVVDGQVVETYDDRRGLKGLSIDIQPEREKLADEIRAATDWSIVLRHGPGPCPARVRSVALSD